MSNQESFTIEQLCKRMSQGKLMGSKCKKCKKTHFPPRPMCDNCYSNILEWVEIKPQGRLLTYTVIHIAPTAFQPIAPYIVGIVELENDLKIPAMIKNVAFEQVKIGMNLKMIFEPCSASSSQWPQWPRYHFEPFSPEN